MKTKKIAALVLLTCLMFCSTALPVFAGNIEDEPVYEDPQEPYVYTYVSSNYFMISNGTAYAETLFVGFSNITSRAVVEIKLQHRFLFWWSDVSGGTWNDTVYDYQGTVSHSLDLTQYGDFRAIFTVRVYGSGSDYDEINQTLYDSN